MKNNFYIIGLKDEDLYLNSGNTFVPDPYFGKRFENVEEAKKYRDIIEDSFVKGYKRILNAVETGDVAPAGIKIPIPILVSISEKGLDVIDVSISTKKVN